MSGAPWGLESWQSLHTQVAIVGQSGPRDKQDCKGADKLHIWFYIRMCKIWKVWKTCAAVSVYDFETLGRQVVTPTSLHFCRSVKCLFHLFILQWCLETFTPLFPPQVLWSDWSGVQFQYWIVPHCSKCCPYINFRGLIENWLRTIWQMHLRNNCISRITEKCSEVEEICT